LLFSLPTLQHSGQFWPEFKIGLANWWTWGLIAVPIAIVDRRLPVPDAQIGWRVLWHVPLSLFFSALVACLRMAVSVVFGLVPRNALSGTEMLRSILDPMFLWTWIIYWLVLGGLLARRYHQQFLSSELRAERLERLSTQAKLHSLRLQLDPHFLFNALNTISAQVESEPKLARRMIEHLGDLLRRTIETKDRLEVQLSEELALLEHYLAIQRIRFAGRLRFDSNIENGVEGAIVPALILQPLVENAIRHGLSRRAAGGRVIVSARRADDVLLLQVEDDGDGLPPDWTIETGEGVGLSVTRQRILAAYGNEAAFEMRPRTGGGTMVLVRLPFRLTGESR
jgi:two-component system, LytTR family, sensor kinase